MAQMFLTCDPSNLVIDGAGVPSCTAWDMREVMYPMYELSGEDLALTMAATATFLITCYVGRRLVKFVDMLGTNGSD